MICKRGLRCDPQRGPGRQPRRKKCDLKRFKQDFCSEGSATHNQLSPPCRHRGRATASVLLGARGPDTIRRPRSRAPRVCGVAGASGATGPVDSPPVFVRAAGLFRHCGVKQESPGCREGAWHVTTSSTREQGPFRSWCSTRIDGIASRASRPCWGERMLSPPSTPPLLREAGSCGGSSGRSASIGEGGCVPSLAACLGVLALAPGLLRGSDAARAACDR